MDNKNVALNTLLIAGLSASLLTGCGIDSFNPANEVAVDMYGPAPIEEEYEAPEIDDTNTDIITEETESTDIIEDVEVEDAVCMYGVDPRVPLFQK